MLEGFICAALPLSDENIFLPFLLIEALSIHPAPWTLDHALPTQNHSQPNSGMAPINIFLLGVLGNISRTKAPKSIPWLSELYATSLVRKSGPNTYHLFSALMHTLHSLVPINLGSAVQDEASALLSSLPRRLAPSPKRQDTRGLAHSAAILNHLGLLTEDSKSRINTLTTPRDKAQHPWSCINDSPSLSFAQGPFDDDLTIALSHVLLPTLDSAARPILDRVVSNPDTQSWSVIALCSLLPFLSPNARLHFLSSQSTLSEFPLTSTWYQPQEFITITTKEWAHHLANSPHRAWLFKTMSYAKKLSADRALTAMAAPSV